jgi:shikimate kinase
MGRIALVGFMGSGKSTVGAQLAEKLDYTFVDLDTFIENRTQMSIPHIFATGGEAHFRQCEQEALNALGNQSRGVVLATGGGVVTQAPSRALLKEAWQAVYLRATPETILARVLQDATERPLLQDEHPDVRIRTLMAQRQNWYEEVADVTIEVDEFSVEMIVQYIADWLDARFAER